MSVWTRLLPFLGWPRPTRQSLRQDLFAGLTVGLVLVPQALAYATLAGMPPVTGLYAALLPGVVGILWGSSPLLAVQRRDVCRRCHCVPCCPAPAQAAGHVGTGRAWDRR